MILRPYQEDMLTGARGAFQGRRSVCLQAPTGAGKTVLFAMITRLARERGNNTWIIVPRNELLEQASETLAKIDVPHGRIAVGSHESRAFDVHVVSKDTLIRRLDKVKIPPDLIIIDEAHLAIDRYKKFSEAFPKTRLLGVTATPERLDGRGLAELYETLVLGPSISELIAGDFLVPVKYFRPPPPKGIEKLHRRGTEFDADELAELLEKRRVYGSAIEHYRTHADGKPALVYCRSVKMADEAAAKFSAAGYRFENIDGTMTYKRRRMLVDALRSGAIQGLTSCELITYGLDVPRVEVVIMLRPTLSRALYCQMVGRGLRPSEGKRELVVLDHVNNLLEHGHPMNPVEWNFEGTKKRKRQKSDDVCRLCPEIDFMYCDKRTCQGCPHAPEGRRTRPKMEYVDGELQEVQAAKVAQRPARERRENIDRMNALAHEYITGVRAGVVSDMLTLAEQLGYNPLYVYRKLTQGRQSVNYTLLHEIARVKGYKPGWAYFPAQALKERNG